MALTFALEEIFRDETVLQLRNKSHYDVSDIKTLYQGLCHKICKKVSFQDRQIFSLSVFGNLSLKIFLHNDGEDFWILGALNFPFPITYLLPNIVNDLGIVTASLEIFAS